MLLSAIASQCRALGGEWGPAARDSRFGWERQRCMVPPLPNAARPRWPKDIIWGPCSPCLILWIGRCFIIFEKENGEGRGKRVAQVSLPEVRGVLSSSCSLQSPWQTAAASPFLIKAATDTEGCSHAPLKRSTRRDALVRLHREQAVDGGRALMGSRPWAPCPPLQLPVSVCHQSHFHPSKLLSLHPYKLPSLHLCIPPNLHSPHASKLPSSPSIPPNSHPSIQPPALSGWRRTCPVHGPRAPHTSNEGSAPELLWPGSRRRGSVTVTARRRGQLGLRGTGTVAPCEPAPRRDSAGAGRGRSGRVTAWHEGEISGTQSSEGPDEVLL